MTSLPSLDIGLRVATGDDGLIRGNRVRRYVDLSTTGSRAAIKTADILKQRNIVQIDCPVSGGVAGAEKGTLAVMVSGPLEEVEPIRSALYAKVQRAGSDLDGKVNYDVSGTLSGNWFADDLPVTQSSGNDISIGGRQIAFARDVRFPDRQRVSIGGFNVTGAWGVPPDAPDFAAITTDANAK